MSDIQVQIKNYDTLKNRITELKNKSEKATSNAVKDMKSRAPGWIATAVAGTYNIKKSEVTPQSKTAKKQQHKSTGINIKGETLETLQFIYQGRRLTPMRFGMTPKKRPESTKNDKGKVTRKAKPYEISAEIIKGKRKTITGNVFLGTTGTSQIPFRRIGKQRLPITSIKTVSVPQMLGKDVVSKEIQEKLNTGLQTRLEHHIKRQKI